MKSISRLGLTSGIMSVLKTGAFITFPDYRNACLIKGHNIVTNDNDIRVDYYSKGRQCFEHFPLDNSGLKLALAFINTLREK